MAQVDRHKEVKDRIIELLRQQNFVSVRPESIRYEDPPTLMPSVGIIVSPMEEGEGVGTNAQDDIRYTFRVTRVIGRTQPTEGLEGKSAFRNKIRQVFHRKRIGGIECELITVVRYADFTSMPKWRKNLDVCSMLITVTVRETRLTS